MVEDERGIRVLITGGCGFIGSHTIRQSLMKENVQKVVNLDLLTYSGHPENVSDIKDKRYSFVRGSINNEELVNRIVEKEDIDIILNLAAESHVDRSIDSVTSFIETNISGTRTLLDCIVKVRAKSGRNVKLIQVSTDEVYGSLSRTDPPFTEDSALDPRNPYAVTKASADMLVSAFVNTHGIDATITRCSNNYGPNQFPEKLIPLMIINSIEGKSLPVYGDGKQIRDWIHVSDHAEGILKVMEGLFDGRLSTGEIINFGADNEVENIEIVHKIIELTNGSIEQLEHVEDRPGHDRRYAMGYSKAERVLEWSPVIKWEEGLSNTIDWYKQNWRWVDSVRSGEYREWIKNQYNQ